jgi:putative hydrolase of HD superfamily
VNREEALLPWRGLDNERLAAQLDFIVRIDRLKSIGRQTLLTDRSRRENSAEHSWHLALMVMVLAEYAREQVDAGRVMKMVLTHDLVEIDAGDTFCYDEGAKEGQRARELAAADRLFSLLPADQAAELRALWDEFETQETPEACFAAALDRLQPLFNNYLTRGGTWQEHDVVRSQVRRRTAPIADGSPPLAEVAAAIIDRAVENGYLRP